MSNRLSNEERTIIQYNSSGTNLSKVKEKLRLLHAGRSKEEIDKLDYLDINKPWTVPYEGTLDKVLPLTMPNPDNIYVTFLENKKLKLFKPKPHQLYLIMHCYTGDINVVFDDGGVYAKCFRYINEKGVLTIGYVNIRLETILIYDENIHGHPNNPNQISLMDNKLYYQGLDITDLQVSDVPAWNMLN